MKPKSKILVGKIIVGLLIFVILFNLLPHQAQAFGWIPIGVSLGIGSLAGWYFSDPIFAKIGDYINYGLAWLLDLGLNLVGILLWLAGQLFDAALSHNLDPATFDPYSAKFGVQFVLRGWTEIRDTANLFFIFILLIIAIAVIIGWETYGIKKALPTLIIIILLINFSLLFTRYVIEFSNSLAEHLHAKTIKLGGEMVIDPKIKSQAEEADTKIKAADDCLKNWSDCWNRHSRFEWWWNYNRGLLTCLTEKNCKDEQEAILKEWQTEKNQILSQSTTNVTIAGLILEGLSPHKIYQVSQEKNADFLTTIRNITVGSILGGILILVAAFVFFSAAILLIIRIVMLWLLMIFAPAALLLWSLPTTESYGRTWLSYLLNQSFFLPVLTFFIWIAVMFSTGLSQVGVTKFQFEGFDVANPGPGFIEFVLNYILVIIMFLASLHFARSMASHGASQMITFGDKARGYALGAAKAGGLAGLEWGRRRGRQEFAREGIAGRVARWGIPYISYKAAELRAKAGKDIEESKKVYGDWATKDLKSRYENVITPKEERAAIAEVLTTRRDLKDLSNKNVKETVAYMKSSGRSTSIIERLRYQWGNMEDKEELQLAMSKVRPQDVRQAIDEGDEATEKLMNTFKKLEKVSGTTISSIEDLSAALELLQVEGEPKPNTTLSNWLIAKQGKDLVEPFFELKGKQEQKTKGKKTRGGGEYDIDEEEFKKR